MFFSLGQNYKYLENSASDAQEEGKKSFTLFSKKSQSIIKTVWTFQAVEGKVPLFFRSDIFEIFAIYFFHVNFLTFFKKSDLA